MNNAKLSISAKNHYGKRDDRKNWSVYWLHKAILFSMGRIGTLVGISKKFTMQSANQRINEKGALLPEHSTEADNKQNERDERCLERIVSTDPFIPWNAQSSVQLVPAYDKAP